MSDNLRLSLEDRKNIVSDLTHLFNSLADAHERAQKDHDYKPTRYRLLGSISREFASIVDFHLGEVRLGQVVRDNYLASAELSAIEMVEYIHQRTKLEQQHEVISTLYNVMQNVSKINSLPFNPSYIQRP